VSILVFDCTKGRGGKKKNPASSAKRRAHHKGHAKSRGGFATNIRRIAVATSYRIRVPDREGGIETRVPDWSHI